MNSRPTISQFRGKYYFLSNFYKCPIAGRDGSIYISLEHAYQAAKTTNIADRIKIASAATPGQAKRLGRQIALRPDWERVKLDVMRLLVLQKFRAPHLKTKLLETGDAILIEGNDWKDTFWGECPLGNGHNWLGKILMEVRDVLRNKQLFHGVEK